MISYELSDKAITQELGIRLKSLRLKKNITQEALSRATMVSLTAIKALEQGKSKLSTIVAVLRELGELERFELFLPDEDTISPLQIAKQNKSRLRARNLNENAENTALGHNTENPSSEDESW